MIFGFFSEIILVAIKLLLRSQSSTACSENFIQIQQFVLKNISFKLMFHVCKIKFQQLGISPRLKGFCITKSLPLARIKNKFAVEKEE